jgi:hypothetical protein
MGGDNDEHFIIQYLPLYLTESTRTWIERLSMGCIDSWGDLRRIFISNFQDT